MSIIKIFIFFDKNVRKNTHSIVFDNNNMDHWLRFLETEWMKFWNTYINNDGDHCHFHVIQCRTFLLSLIQASSVSLSDINHQSPVKKESLKVQSVHFPSRVFFPLLLLILCFISHRGVLHHAVAIWKINVEKSCVLTANLDSLVTSLRNIKTNYFSHSSSWFANLQQASSHISPSLLLSCQTMLAGPESSKIMTPREDANISHFTPVTCRPGTYFPFAIWNILQVSL